MTAAAAVRSGRRLAESLMIDACTVKAVTGVTPDPLSGADVPTYSAPIYTGKCKVQGLDPLERTQTAAGGAFTMQRYRIDVPVGAFIPATRQIITITAATLDPNLAGREFRVVALLHKTFATAYRLGVEEVT